MGNGLNLLPTKLKGVWEILNLNVSDERGFFSKVYNKNIFDETGLRINFKECFFSSSRKNVVRGMHFQTPPFDHGKLVFVTSGKIIDIVLDIRVGSETYGKYQEFELSSLNKKSLYISKGFAHGFKSIEENTTTIYLTTEVYNSKFDKGINYNSFGYFWGDDLVVSERDSALENFSEFKSPFKMEF